MVLNRAAGLIKSIPPQDRTTSLLIQLHWLLGKVRLVLKLCALTSQALILITQLSTTFKNYYMKCSPVNALLIRLINPLLDSHFMSHSSMYSSNATGLLCTFSSAVYSKPPLDVRQTNDLFKFKKELKVFFFFFFFNSLVLFHCIFNNLYYLEFLFQYIHYFL